MGQNLFIVSLRKHCNYDRFLYHNTNFHCKFLEMIIFDEEIVLFDKMSFSPGSKGTWNN